MTSMRRRLLVWLLSSVLLGGFAAAAVVFYEARRQSTEFFDYQLRQLALTLRDRDYTVRELAQALQGQQDLDFVIQVWGPDGRLLYGSHPQIEVPAPSGTGFSDAVTATGRWRVFAIWHRGLTIQVAQHKLAREALALGAALRTLLPFVLVLPLMGFLIWRLVGREVRFLETTARAVASRSPESLEPIEGGMVPDEIRPLVASLNDLLARLGAALSQQRQFIADAAHELRTPLTALRLQLQLAQRARDPAEREKALETLGEGITRATHVVEQLLAMARQDPAAQAEEMKPIDLAALARDVVEAARPGAEHKGLALHLDSRLDQAIVGDRTALRALVENLLDNAVRYTPQGSITVRTYRAASDAVFEVEDTGPGIPAAERERVFDRFYRGSEALEGGSGLGLSIVRRIAERHRGKVELASASGANGLLVRVRFPLSPP
ncbi:MAG TPA: ATP-binding protein [Usitatibacter sp.]|nr:ATP-binding protein [Usitatibacter sp.]